MCTVNGSRFDIKSMKMKKNEKDSVLYEPIAKQVGNILSSELKTEKYSLVVVRFAVEVTVLAVTSS